MSRNIHVACLGRLVVRYMCPHHLPIRPYACAMAFCPCFCRRCLVIYMWHVLAGLWYDICVPTIYQSVHTHAQWRFVLVFAVDASSYTCGMSWQACGTIYVSPPSTNPSIRMRNGVLSLFLP